MAQRQGVSLGGLQVGFNHLADQLVEADAQSPSKFAQGLACIADQRLDLGGAGVARIDRDDDFAGWIECLLVCTGALPGEVKFEQLGAALDELAHAVLLAGGDHIIPRLLLLQHEPLHLDVVACVAPVAPCVEIAEILFALQAGLVRVRPRVILRVTKVSPRMGDSWLKRIPLQA
jgi:hypothetical protein